MGILIASAWVALTIIVVFEPFSGDRLSTGDCSGAFSTDYACHQERYQNLVRDSGVEAVFKDIEDEYEKNDFVKSGCHQLTHVIGRPARYLRLG